LLAERRAGQREDRPGGPPGAGELGGSKRRKLESRPGCLAHYHFCRAFNEETLNPLAFVRNLSLGLAGRYPFFAQALRQSSAQGVTINFDVDQKIGSIQPGGTVQGVVINNLQISGLSARLAFDQLVRQPLQALCDSDFKETVLILVDSLDEALTYDPQENIAYLLAQYTDDPDDLPQQVRLLLTGRPDPRLKARFGQPDLDLVDLAPDNLDDVRRYAAARLKDAPDPPRTELVSQIQCCQPGQLPLHTLRDRRSAGPAAAACRPWADRTAGRTRVDLPRLHPPRAGRQRLRIGKTVTGRCWASWPWRVRRA